MTSAVSISTEQDVGAWQSHRETQPASRAGDRVSNPDSVIEIARRDGPVGKTALLGDSGLKAAPDALDECCFVVETLKLFPHRCGRGETFGHVVPFADGVSDADDWVEGGYARAELLKVLN